MDGFYEKLSSTFFNPELNVGLGKFILGEYVLNEKDVISGYDILLKNFDETLRNWLGDLSLTRYYKGGPLVWTTNIVGEWFYARNYDQEIFKEPIILISDDNNCLIKIFCKIRSEYKDIILQELENKYGRNKRLDYEIQSFYRTEVFNNYGIIQIRLIFNDKENKLSLEMEFVQIDTTKPQMEKSEERRRKRETEELRLQKEIDKLEITKKEQEKRKLRNIQDLIDI